MEKSSKPEKDLPQEQPVGILEVTPCRHPESHTEGWEDTDSRYLWGSLCVGLIYPVLRLAFGEPGGKFLLQVESALEEAGLFSSLHLFE